MPRHHKKSNNGVFSKKQKKASRHMMANRMTRSHPPKALSMPDLPSAGLLSGILSLIMGRARRG